MPFPEAFIRELSDRNDIADTVSAYVRLTKRSGSNQFGLCPFHSEKTPSFSVNPEKQMFYCFGCGKGGGVVNFIMELENLSYSDAVRHLAKRAGLTVPEDKPDPNKHRRERMLELNRLTARFFHDKLNESAAAQDYVARRGISRGIVKTFGIGYAPNTWDALTNEMKARGFTQAELFDAGLVAQGRSGGVYDVFRNRLMFPVIDVRGDVIGFSGRIIGDGEPKYLNSKETLVFNKSRNLFGLNLAKKSKKGYIILSEGNMDVVALHGAGFDSAVASLGTSLTAEQARLISRYTSKVIIAFDNDNAGKAASSRAIELLEKLDLNVRVLSMREAKDPDEFIRSQGATAFQKLIDAAENHVEYRVAAVAAKYKLDSDEDKVAFLREVAQTIAELHNSVEREVYGIRVAEMTGVSKDAVTAEITRLRRILESRAKKEAERVETAPVRSGQPTVRALAYENIRSARAEEGVIRLLYNEPSLMRFEGLPDASEFSSEFLGKLYSEITHKIQDGEQPSFDRLGDSFTREEISHLARFLQEPENLNDAERNLTDYIRIIKDERMQMSEDGLLTMAEEYRQTKGEYRTKGYGDEADVR